MKLIDGILARDKRTWPGKKPIVFYPGRTCKDIYLDASDGWCWGGTKPAQFTTWTLQKWRATYDLTPPKPG